MELLFSTNNDLRCARAALTRTIAGWLLVLAGPWFTAAGATEPKLDLIVPRGGQRGTNQQVEFQGERLGDTLRIVFLDSGLTADHLEVIDARRIKATLVIAADCPLGQHAVRLHTRGGVSEVRSFHVGPFPALREREPNDEIESAQPAGLATTIDGVLLDRDRDCFQLDLKRGQRFSAEVEGVRLGTVAAAALDLIDPALALLDADGKTVVEADDNRLTGRDPVLSTIIPRDGRYTLVVKDVALCGIEQQDRRYYRLHLGEFIRPLTAYPPGGRPGAKLPVKWIDASGEIGQETIQLPRETREPGIGEIFPGRTVDQLPTPNRLRINDFPALDEKEPNENVATALPGKHVTPVAFNGIISQPGDVDCFRFRTGTGGGMNVRVYAKKVGSPLDTVAAVLNTKGQVVSEADDSAFMDDMDGDSTDSFIRFSADVGVDYVLRVSGRLGEGGPDHVYRAEITPAVPWLASYIREYSQFSQKRLAVAVPRGNRFVTMLGFRRGNVAGPLKVRLGELPPGVSCRFDEVHPAVDAIPLVFEAAPDAPLGASQIEVETTLADKPSVRGPFYQQVELSVSRPYYVPYATYLEPKLVVAVVEETPYRIEIDAPRVPLVRNGSMQLDVHVSRQAGFNQDIEVQIPYKPPGVGAAPSLKIPAGETVGRYPFSAASNAELGNWKIGALALARHADGGEMCVASDLITLEIAEPFLDVGINLAATQQGSSAEVPCRVQVHRPFDGAAQLVLKGLPTGASAEMRQLNSTAKAITFHVTTNANCPIGRFNQLYCEATVFHQGKPIVHNVGQGGILRVDRPSPRAAEAAKPTAPGLSRLEQLRQEYAEWLRSQRR